MNNIMMLNENLFTFPNNNLNEKYILMINISIIQYNINEYLKILYYVIRHDVLLIVLLLTILQALCNLR